MVIGRGSKVSLSSQWSQAACLLSLLFSKHIRKAEMELKRKQEEEDRKKREEEEKIMQVTL